MKTTPRPRPFVGWASHEDINTTGSVTVYRARWIDRLIRVRVTPLPQRQARSKDKGRGRK